MYEIRVEGDFCAAHFLRDYHGKCENLHGHNYKVYAHVKGTALDRSGMLLDFTELKRALKTACSDLDHTNLNDMPVFCQNPSAERIAGYLYDSILALMKKNGTDLSFIPGKTSAVLYAVDVFETEHNRARYCVE